MATTDFDATPPKDGGNDDDGFTRSQKGRWIVALIVALGAAGYYLLGVHNQVLCHGALAAGKEFEVCGPPGVSELVPFALVIAVLLAPDLTELGIVGLFSLKRTVKNQEERQENVEAQLMRVEQNVAVTQRSTQALNLAVNIAGERIDAKSDMEWTKEIRDNDEEDQDGTPAKAPEPPPPDRDEGGAGLEPPIEEDTEGGLAEVRWPSRPAAEMRQALLGQQILYLADSISQFASLAQTRVNSPGELKEGYSEEEMERVDRWYSVFSEEIELVRTVRNTVAHQPFAMGLEELEEANRVARKVLRILFGGLDIEPTVIERFEEQLGDG